MMRDIKIIGLCGRSGSGKGYVSRIFSDMGIPCIDTDKVYRDIVSDKNSACLSELVSEFGVGILSENGILDRKKLSSVVFADGAKEKLLKLNEITHKYILEETLSLAEKAREDNCDAVVIDAPVLFESGFDRLCDVKVCVLACDEVCVKRICERDGRSEEDAKKRLASQKANEELLSLCDFSIINDKDGDDVRSQILEFIKKYVSEDSDGI